MAAPQRKRQDRQIPNVLYGSIFFWPYGSRHTAKNSYKSKAGLIGSRSISVETLCSLAFATALLALASSEASAFIYSSFVCQAVGARSVAYGRSFFVGDAKLIALSRCAPSQRNLRHQLLRSAVNWRGVVP